MKSTKVFAGVFLLLATTHGLLPDEVSATPVYSSGHADIGLEYDAAARRFRLFYNFGEGVESEDGTPIERTHQAPTAVATRVPDPAFPRPFEGSWDFLGANADEPIWYNPQTNEPSKPFFGFATEHLSPPKWSGPIRWSLTGLLEGPADGEFSLWQTDIFGSPLALFATSDGIDEEDEFVQGVGGHDHFNWGFTQPGVYRVELSAEGTHVTDGLVTGAGIFTFLVGNETSIVDPDLPGDTDGDGDVDLDDLNNVRNHFGESGVPVLGDTAPFDGQVNLDDLNNVRNNFGAAAPVPESSSVALAAVSVLALSAACLKRRRGQLPPVKSQ
jgi:surface-anchored protein